MGYFPTMLVLAGTPNQNMLRPDYLTNEQVVEQVSFPNFRQPSGHQQLQILDKRIRGGNTGEQSFL